MKKNLTNSPIANVSTGACVLDLVDFIQLRKSLLKGVHATNKRLGSHLTQEDEEDIVQEMLSFFIEKCQQGIYDISQSTPEQYLLGGKRTWGPVQSRIRAKLSQKQLPESSADDMDDEDRGTFILARNVYGIQPDVFRGETENKLLKVILEETSDRDRKVIKHLMAGTPRKEMELDLGLSQNTLNKLIFDVRKRLRAKLAVKNYPILAA